MYNVDEMNTKGNFITMFKFDKYTLPYHITNLIFYVFTLAVIGFIYVYIFYPPLSDVATLRILRHFRFA